MRKLALALAIVATLAVTVVATPSPAHARIMATFPAFSAAYSRVR